MINSFRVVAAFAACSAVAVIVPSAHADMYYNTARTIGVEPASIWVGTSASSGVFTVTANAGTYVTGSFNTFNRVTVNMSGGTVTNSVTAGGFSRFNLGGGSVNGAVVVEGSAIFMLTGGSVTTNLGTNVTLRDTARFDITGGLIGGQIYAGGSSVVNISGGSPGQWLNLSGNATINLYGTNLRVLATSVQPTQTIYTLAGTLADGTVLSNLRLTRITTGSPGSSFHLLAVPTPGTAALMGLGGLAIARRPR